MQLTFISNEYANLTLDEKCLTLQNFFESQIDSIDRQLVRDLSFISQLAHYKQGMKVTQIEAIPTSTPAGTNPDSILDSIQSNFYLFFEYEWHIFQGCMGMEDSGVMKDKVKFTVDSSRSPEISLILDLSPFQTLSTADEL